jgi:hypothetical protein
MLGITTCKSLDKWNEQADHVVQTSQLLDGSSGVVYLRAHRMAIVEDTQPSTNLGCETENCDGEVCQFQLPKWC